MVQPGFPNPSVTGGTSQEIFELSWELFGELCRALALRVYREYDPDVVVGIATAGVIPAAVIAGQLAHARAMSAILNTTVNSYKRLADGHRAPGWATR